MCGTYFLALFLILGVNGIYSFHRSPRSDDDNAIVFPTAIEGKENFSSLVNDLALDSKQLSKLEIILNNVITKYLGPLPAKLSLRTAEDGKSGLVKTVRMIGDAICNGIRNLFDKLGLPQSPRRRPANNYKMSKPADLRIALVYELARFPLELAPIWQSAKAQINRHMHRHNYTSMGYKSVQIELRTNRENSTQEWKFLAIFGTIGTYGTNFFNCLDQKTPSSFDFKRAVGDLTNLPPEMTGKILRSRLGKRLPRSTRIKRTEYTEFHAFVCHAAANDSRLDYRDCLVEIKRVDKCVQMKFNDSSASEDPITKSSRDFLRGIKGLDTVSCNDVNRELKNVSLTCMLKTKKSNEFPYIVDFFMGDSLKKSPTLGRMTRELGSLIKRSQTGSKAVNEIATLIEMYKRGMEKKEQLLKFTERDVVQRHRYNRMADHLAQYRRYCIDFAKTTASYLHRGVSSLENVLVDPSLGIARENLTENARALKCWSGFMESVFGSWSHSPGPFPTTPYPTSHVNRTNRFMNPAKRRRLPGLMKFPNEVGFVRKTHEEPLRKLIESMKRLGQQGQPRRSSALVTLANTFLLATMFYESIAVVAAAIYRQDSTPLSPSTSAENEESDRWPPRDRRSPPYPIDQENLQPTQMEAEKESTTHTEETYETAPSSHHHNSEGMQEEIVGNPIDEEDVTDPVESTTISNNLFNSYP